MAMRRTFSHVGSTVCLALLFLACGDDAGESIGEVADAPADAPAIPGARPQLLDEVEALCLAAGGTWNSYQCRCPQGIFTTASGGVCSATRFGTSDCMNRGFTNVLASDGVAGLRRCLRGAVVIAQRSSLQLSPDFADALAGPLAQWLDDHVRSRTLRANLPSDAGSPQQILVHLLSPSAADLPILLDRTPSYPMPGNVPGSVIVLRNVYARDVAALGAAVGDVSGEWTPDRSQADAALSLLLRAVDVASFVGAPAYLETPILEGCRVACEIAAEWPLDHDGLAYSIRRIRRYHRGTLLDERLELTSPDRHQLVGWVSYDLGSHPNLLATLTYDGTPFLPTVSLYDSALLQRDQARFDTKALAQVDRWTEVVAAAPPLAAGDAAIVVCEGDVGGALDDAVLSTAVLSGPHRGPACQDGESLFGWRSAAPGDVSTYLDGVITTHFTLPVVDEFYVSHAGSMANLALGVDMQTPAWPGLRIIPLSAETCILEPTALGDVAAQDSTSQIRIVSLSATLPIDHAACAELMPNGVDPHYLWVTASGNAGRAFANLESAQNCPQSLSQRDNLLVVDGTDRGQYFDFSDHGPMYSDIAAESDGLGTSNSAPRVAHVAARIAQEHGERISVQMIRQAILLSARVPDPPLPNRTGGVLDAEAALEMARSIVDQGSGLATSLEVNMARDLRVQRKAGHAHF